MKREPAATATAEMAAIGVPRGRLWALAHHPRTSWLVLAVMVAATVAVWRLSVADVERRIEEQFHRRVDETHAAIEDRMLHYQQVLRGAVGFFAGSNGVERDEWQDYVRKLELDERVPGMEGMGFVARIPARARSLHVDAVRNDGLPEYRVWPESSREELYPVVYLAPLSTRNLRSFGFDMGSQPVLLAAMSRARLSGLMTATAQVELAHESTEDRQAGFIIFSPIYRRGVAVETPGDRQRALLGFVYSRFRGQDVMRGILGNKSGELAFGIYDGQVPSSMALLAGAVLPDRVTASARSLRAERRFSVAGRSCLVRYDAGPQFEAHVTEWQPVVVLIGGLFIDLLLFFVIGSLSQTHKRAVTIAARLTERTREAANILRAQQVELVRAKNSAEEATLAKSQFLARMSHEMRTPLNGIVGMLDLTLMTSLTRDQSEFLRTASTSASSLLDIINEVLDFSKIEAGKLSIDTTSFSLRELLGVVVRGLAVKAQEKGLEIVVPAGARMPDRWRGDPMRLRQVLTNLIGNAIKFTERGEIVVAASWEKTASGARMLRFRVTDTGIGVPKERQSAIFEPFTQADETVSRRYGGTGLGLSISTQLVTLMGGQLSVQSELGKGSTFSFELPLEPESLTRTTGSGLIPLPSDGVLILAEHALLREELGRHTAETGMKPTLVASHAEALEALASASAPPLRWLVLDADLDAAKASALWAAFTAHTGESPQVVVMAPLAGPGRDRPEVIAASPGASPARMTTVHKPLLGHDLRAALARLQAGHNQRRQPTSKIPTMARTLHVLVAEDNVINQVIARRLLEVAGQKVTVVADGRAACRALESGGFDVVLMDVRMPEMDGLEATRAIRARERERGGRVPIVAVTAQALDGDKEECLAAGMDAYVTKPLRPELLFEAIKVATASQAPASGVTAMS